MVIEAWGSLPSSDGGWIYALSGASPLVTIEGKGSRSTPWNDGAHTLGCEEREDNALDWLKLSFTFGELASEGVPDFGCFRAKACLTAIERFNRS